MITLLTILYLCCFAGCAIPATVRVIRRKSSEDLSMWREWLLIAGVSLQFAVMLLTGSAWQVWVSPLLSGASIGVLLVAIYRYRKPR